MVEIRPAIPEDIPELIELRHERALLQRQRIAPNVRELWSSELDGWLKDVDGVAYVAVSNGQIVGYILGRVQSEQRKGVISELVLDLHQYQGGAGRLLVDVLHQWFRDCNIEQVVVSVHPRLPVEQAFWRALGAVK